MKIRIGVGLGARFLDAEALGQVVDDLAELKFDSLWLPEILTGETVDPIVGLAWAAARHPKLKLGTTMLLPGRHPVRLAKQLAGLDALSNGRLLVTFVPGLTRRPERDAIGVPPKERTAAMAELLPLVRRLLDGEPVSYDGAFGRFDDVTISPRPAQKQFDMWLGGLAPATLELCGRAADGWLPALLTPEEAAAGRTVIERAAAEAGREISPEHYGVSIGYRHGPLDPAQAAAIAARARGHDVETLVPDGFEALRARLEEFIAVGFSKFVVRPSAPFVSLRAELEALAAAVSDLQT